MNITKSLDHFMYELRLNQSKLADYAGLDFSTLNLIYNKHRLPSLVTIQKLAVACDVKVSEFIAAGE
jgi:transcriptional regulator with XRE-family HTH domain|tara:strand:- start:242 stop:442 length:201 start_codon:yes stop_codon:yes gene_type:complete